MQTALTPGEVKAFVATKRGQIDFYYALRLIENAYRTRPRIGQALRPHDESLRLGQKPSLAFPAATIESFQPSKDDDEPSTMLVNFLGLLGPNGPLPLHITEYTFNRLQHEGDATLSKFLDMFHHRMLSLFYRAWAQAQPVVNHDRPEDDRFAEIVASVCGYGMTSLKKRDVLPDKSKLYFAGLLAPQQRSAENLVKILQEFFQLPVRLQQFVGQWIEIPLETRTRLEGPDNPNAQLGVSATIGKRSWQAQHKFRIILGPLDSATYKRFLPGGSSAAALEAWVRTVVGDSFDWDVQLTIASADVPTLQLGKNTSQIGEDGGRLGWLTWLGGRPASRKTDALVVDIRSHVQQKRKLLWQKLVA